MSELKKPLMILCIVFVSLVVLGIVKDQVAKVIVQNQITHITGARVKIGGMSVGVFRPAVKIRDFKLLNPEGFPKEHLVYLPQVSLQYDLPSVLKKKLRLPVVMIDLEDLVLVKNKEGKLNVDSLRFTHQEEKSKRSGAQPSPDMPLQIDEVILSIGMVVFKDYSRDEKEPTVQVYDVGMKDKRYKNITSAQQLATLIIVEAMKPTAIKGAAIYSTATILGAGFLPAGVAGVLLGKDEAVDYFHVSLEKAYHVSLECCKEKRQSCQRGKRGWSHSRKTRRV